MPAMLLHVINSYFQTQEQLQPHEAAQQKVQGGFCNTSNTIFPHSPPLELCYSSRRWTRELLQQSPRLQQPLSRRKTTGKHHCSQLCCAVVF